MPRPTGTQTRTFNYDLPTGRLMSATNPENGTVAYYYNADGTLDYKIDAKNQKVDYIYDSYQRVTQIKRYQGSTEVTCERTTFYYDTNPLKSGFSQNTWGRLAAAQWGGTSCTGGQWTEMYSYTAPGRVSKKRLNRGDGVSGPYLEGSWTWDNEGRMASVTYPNGGRRYTYTFDTMGRPVKLTDNQSPVLDWVKDVLYNAAGQITSMKYIFDWTAPQYYTETRTFNVLGQLARLTAGGAGGIDEEYIYPAANNGRIERKKNWLSGEEVNYQYDALNRLISAVTTGPEWGQSWGRTVGRPASRRCMRTCGSPGG